MTPTRWTRLFLGLTKLQIDLGWIGGREQALENAKLANLQTRTENVRLQARLTTLRTQKMGNEVTQAEQKAEKLELEILKLRHELESKGVLKSDHFQEPSY